MKKRVYVETTIISYLASRPSRDLVLAAHQEVAREWWAVRREVFNVFISQVVIAEASDGGPDAVRRRLALLAALPVLDITDEAVALAEKLIDEGPLPREAADDALHIALATAHGMDFLLTWNCRHLANAQLLNAVGSLLIQNGYVPPVICTPEELMESSDA